MPEEIPEYVQTLNELIARKTLEWGDDLPKIVEGLREQSTRWNIEQSAGSRKRVTSKQIPVDVKLPKLVLKLPKLKV